MKQTEQGKKLIINLAAGLVSLKPIQPITMLMDGGSNNFGRKSLTKAVEETEENLRQLGSSLRAALDSLPLEQLDQERAVEPEPYGAESVRLNMLDNFINEGFSSLSEARLRQLVAGESPDPDEVTLMARVMLSYRQLR